MAEREAEDRLSSRRSPPFRVFSFSLLLLLFSKTTWEEAAAVVLSGNGGRARDLDSDALGGSMRPEKVHRFRRSYETGGDLVSALELSFLDRAARSEQGEERASAPASPVSTLRTPLSGPVAALPFSHRQTQSLGHSNSLTPASHPHAHPAVSSYPDSFFPSSPPTFLSPSSSSPPSSFSSSSTTSASVSPLSSSSFVEGSYAEENDAALLSSLMEQAPVRPPEPRDRGGGRRVLEELMLSEVSCRQLTQAMIVVDGGSSKTLPSLFTAVTESCPQEGRRVLEGTLKFVGEGTKVAGVRDLLEDWLDAHAGKDWESRELDAQTLMRSFPSMQEQANKLVARLIQDVVALLNSRLSETEKEEVKALGVPVFFHTTAGVRGFPDWYRDGMFVALRRAINASPPVEGYLFFTNKDWTRAISGEVEGIYAFLTANLLTRNFERLLEDAPGVSKESELHAHRKLAGIVEVGGASMQIVFPVRPFVPFPPFAKVSNLQKEGYLPHSYPPVDLVAVSFMQLGASSASGVFLKMLCGKEEYLRDGICRNPCLFRGFEQACSAGEVTIGPTGEIHVSSNLRKNRLKPAATFCGGGNAEIMYKLSNRIECMATRINPLLPLEQRMQIPNCEKIVGTGDFAACAKEVEDILINPNLPLPANQEAVSLGFETPAQIFKFISSSAPLFVTGASLVSPVKLLQAVNLLPKDFDGTARAQLVEAATKFCATPVSRESDGSLSLRVEASAQRPDAPPAKPVKLTTLNYETCHRLAMAASVLQQIDSGARKPNSVRFETKVTDDGSEVGPFGWQAGTILHHVANSRQWSTAAYELGVGHTFHDRKIALADRKVDESLEGTNAASAEAVAAAEPSV
ncbi:GDA1/CD39 (nucleoside phosphatase) family protein [Toxoplasma gondii MAS]|uniref:GDA1/CD39 (Nucleoside phosphatase) family protein n=2 Tax=Toxoplasma gondii TaxID=5811 RepID=A0A086QJA7_TOXGO|nr:GDA1/CD39 (nucleoside phosphatase) family protein [Toxoplasma gondii MAS]PUA85203.1 GDA1/CD39 (nucleoside phosphatase) family protein [Toxoplasma gondii TgCATBr9]